MTQRLYHIILHRRFRVQGAAQRAQYRASHNVTKRCAGCNVTSAFDAECLRREGDATTGSEGKQPFQFGFSVACVRVLNFGATRSTTSLQDCAALFARCWLPRRAVVIRNTLHKAACQQMRSSTHK